jgi:hypothetical protein
MLESPLTKMQIPQTGGCMCGAARYAFTGEPEIVLNCHCIDCQKATGGQFTTIIALRAEHFTSTGKLTFYDWRGSSGTLLRRGFCPICGTPVFGYPPDPNVRNILAGTLDDSDWVVPTLDHWLKSRKPWSVPLDTTEKCAYAFE